MGKSSFNLQTKLIHRARLSRSQVEKIANHKRQEEEKEKKKEEEEEEEEEEKKKRRRMMMAIKDEDENDDENDDDDDDGGGSGEAFEKKQLSARGRQSEIKRFTATSSRKLQNLRAKGEERPPFGYSKLHFPRKIIAQTCDKLSDYGRKFEPPVLLTIENLLSILKFKQPRWMIKDEYYRK
uniref:Uncharacterized protein n=1 Tax=Vespula pensylvanica TaxID=30213 RepID=A0A834NZZ4_VESPE|nr:hypothetical protein H0235_008382 [Vespula pensylvanica]